MVMMKLVLLLLLVVVSLLEAFTWSAGQSRQDSLAAAIVRDDDDGFTGSTITRTSLALSSSELQQKNTKKLKRDSDAVGGEFINSPLSCHQCHSFVDGQRCAHLAANSTVFQKACNKTESSCMVRV